MTNENDAQYLNWIDHQKEEMVTLVQSWSNIDSNTTNLDGLNQMLNALKEAFVIFNPEEIFEYALPLYPRINQEGKLAFFPLGKALHLKKRPKAPIQILLAGHMDTAFDGGGNRAKCEIVDTNILKGPGVADMKGGLVIMLKTIEALENSAISEKIGWQIFINPDEEIGSPGSAGHFARLAHECHFGMLFEPPLVGGEFASFRKGSANYAVVAKGKAAHVGRDPENGRSAINALAQFISFIEKLSHPPTGLVVNVGSFHGGIANSIVPPLATCQFNVRGNDASQMEDIEKKMGSLLKEIGKDRDVSLTLYPIIHRPPKSIGEDLWPLFNLLKECGKEIGLDIKWHGTGGVCDGNILAGEGLLNIDTFGARGGNIHTAEEFIYIDSLTERTKLATLFLMKLAEINIKP